MCDTWGIDKTGLEVRSTRVITPNTAAKSGLCQLHLLGIGSRPHITHILSSVYNS